MSLLQYIKSKEFLRTVIMIVAISLILVFVLFKWLDYHTKHDEKITVPNLEMLSLSETEQKLEELKLKEEAEREELEKLRKKEEETRKELEELKIKDIY